MNDSGCVWPMGDPMRPCSNETLRIKKPIKDQKTMAKEKKETSGFMKVLLFLLSIIAAIRLVFYFFTGKDVFTGNYVDKYTYFGKTITPSMRNKGIWI